MGQFSTDFSSYTTDAQPSDWTKILDLDCDWTVKTASGEGLATAFGTKILKENVSDSDLHGLYWTIPGTPTNIDTIVRIQIYDQGAGMPTTGIGARMGTDAYYLCLNLEDDWEKGKLVIKKYYNSIESVLDTYIFGEDMALLGNFDTWYCLRFQVNGSDLKGKIWKADEAEPASWQVSVVDTDIPGAGWVGVITQADSYCDWFGVGTEGDLPPDFPAVEGSGRLTQAQIEASRETEPKGRITQSAIEVERDNPNRYGRLSQAVIEAIRGMNAPGKPSFIIFDIRHDLKKDRIKYKCMRMPGEPAEVNENRNGRLTQGVIEVLRTSPP